MGRRLGRTNKKKKSNLKLKANNQFGIKQISLVAAEPSIDRESISTKFDENTLVVESLSETKLQTSQRRSTRACVTVNTTYQCKICHLVFSTEYNLRQHLDYYGDPRYPCQECGTKFTDRKQLQSHILNAHGRLNPKFSVKCPICKQMFALSPHLQAHLSHYHEEWKESIKTEEDSVKSPTEFKTAEVGSQDWIQSSVNCVENSKNRTQLSTTINAHLQTQQSVETDCSAKTVENVTSLATVSRNRVEGKENKSDERSREEEQAVSTNAQNTDVLRNRLESKCKSEDTMRKNEHPVCVNGENSYSHCNELEIKADQITKEDLSIVCVNGGEKHNYPNRLKDSENKSNQIMRENEQVLCLNRENSQVLVPRLEDKSDTITKRRTKDESDKRSRENEAPANEKRTQSLTLRIIPVELDKPLNKGIKPSVTMYAVPNEDEVVLSNIAVDVSDEKGVEIESIRGSNNRHEIDIFNNFRVTAKNPKNITLLDARSGEDKIAVTSTCFQKKAQENNAKKSLCEVRNHEEEMELRRLYSCKNCYVPLVRVKIPETIRETAKATAELPQSHSEQSHTVIPSIVCDRAFASRRMMLRHYRQRHFSYSDNKMHCVCGRVMVGFEAVRAHFYRYCQKTVPVATMPTRYSAPCKPLEKKFACTGCGEKFWVESCLGSHMYSCKSFIEQKMQKMILKNRNRVGVSRGHICRVCRAAFSSKKNLVEHEKTYSRTATFRCNFCGTMFSGEYQLRTHMRTAHDLHTKTHYPYVCSVCNQGFTHKRYECIHRMHIHPDQVLLENDREPVANNLSPLDLDGSGDNETSINKCNVCNLVFLNKKRFIDHTIYYTKSELIHCKACGEQFEGQYRAHHHNKTVHYSADMEIAFTHHCNICKEGFMYMTHLQAHMFHVHISEANITTPVDQNHRNESSSQQNSSQPVDSWLYELRDRDVGTVPGTKYACSVCALRFPTQAHLAAHEIDFANDGVYSCNRCSRKCSTPAMLLDHLTLNHSNNAMQGRVKCRRCNENFLTQRTWVSHVKHFHSTEEPSEFYLEENIAFTEQSGDVRYELIPTNETISGGVTYSNIKSSIDERRINVAIPEGKKLKANSSKKTEKTSFNVDRRRVKVKRPEQDVLVINDFNEIAENESLIDTNTINTATPHEKQSATKNDRQAVNTNLVFDAGQIKVEDPEKKKATSVFRRICEVTKKRICHKRWNCSTCGCAFSSPINLARHMSLYSNSGRYMCETCGRRFHVNQFYQKHKLNHTLSENIKYFCSSCNEGFRWYQNMKMHVVHLHPKSLRAMPSKVTEKDLALKHQELHKSRRPSRRNARPRRCPQPNFYRGDVPSFVTESDPHRRTFSRKEIEQPAVMLAQGDSCNLKHVEAVESPRLLKQPAMVLAQGDSTNPKYVEADESPRIHTGIFEDAISTIYECPKCKKNYCTIEQLDAHLKAVHTSNRDEKELRKPSKSSDAHVTCDACDKVFLNKKSLDTHTKKIHSMKSVEIVRSSAPVLEITAPINGPEVPKNEQLPIVIGRLYKLERINILPKPVDHGKKEVTKKLAVTKILGPNSKQQKLLATNIVQKKANFALQMKRWAANIVKSKPTAANAVQLKLPASNAVRVKPPAANVVQLKPLAANAALLKPLPASTTQPKPPVANAVQLKLLASNAVRLKPPAANVVQLKPLAANAVLLKPLPASTTQPKPPAANAVQLRSLAAYDVQLKPSAANAVQLTPLAASPVHLNRLPAYDVQLTLPTANAAQLKPLAANAVQLKPRAANDAQRKCRRPSRGPRNLPKVKAQQQNPPKPVQRTEVVRISSIDPTSRGASKSVISSNVATLPIPSSPSALIKPIKIVKVESHSSVASTIHNKFHDQFACNTCHMVFMNTSQLTAHEKCNHSSTSSSDQPVDNSFTEATSSSMDQLRQLVINLPVEPQNGNDTEAQMPFSFNFESVLIPVSADDFDFSEEESGNIAELEGNINPLEQSVEKNLSPEIFEAAPLKVRPFATIVENLGRNDNRKRKDDNPIDMLATKRPKGVFDPIAYKELCRQHNLVLNRKPYEPKSSSRTTKSKTVTGN